MTRRIAVLVVVLALTCGAAAMGGAAATLGVSSRSIDTFTAALPASTSTTSGDSAAPALVALEMFDTNANGKVDQVKATFNEALAAYTAGTTPWTLANVPSGGTLSAVAVSGSIATLTIAEGGGAANTAVGTFTVALAQSTTGIRDAAGNRSSFAATAPADEAGPVPTAVVVSNKVNGNDGKPEVDDFATITFSEPLSLQSICANTSDLDWTTGSPHVLNDNHQVTATFTEAGTDSLGASAAACVGGLHFGSIRFDDEGYVSTDTAFGGTSPNQTELSWNPTTRQLRLLLGTPSTATGDVNASSVTATYSPSTLMTDAAGNAAAGSIDSAKARQF